MSLEHSNRVTGTTHNIKKDMLVIMKNIEVLSLNIVKHLKKLGPK